MIRVHMAERFVELFGEFDHVVSPVGQLRFHGASSLRRLVPRQQAVRAHARPHLELCEFLVDVLGIKQWPVPFAHRVSLHAVVTSARTATGRCSERVGPQVDKVRDLLKCVPGIQLVDHRDPMNAAALAERLPWLRRPFPY